jgi:hypothetical protein
VSSYSVSPHEFNIQDIIHALNIRDNGNFKSFELLCRFVNENKLPLHCNVKELDLSNYCNGKASMSNYSGELKIINLEFDSTPSLFEPPLEGDNRGKDRYKLLSFELKNTCYSLNSGAGTIIYDKEIYGKRDDIFTFIGERNYEDEQLQNGKTVKTKVKQEKGILQQRLDALRKYFIQLTKQDDLTLQEYYDVNNKPTKKALWTALQHYDRSLFKQGEYEFFKAVRKSKSIKFKPGTGKNRDE